MSASQSMDTRTSSAMSAYLLARPLPFSVKVREALLQVQRCGDAFERQPQLHHRERHFGLDADDDGLRAAEHDHVRDVTERAGGERVDHVERRDVDDDTPRANLADRYDERVA